MDRRTIHVHVLCIHPFTLTTRLTSTARRALALPIDTPIAKGLGEFNDIKNLFEAAFSRTAKDAPNLSMVIPFGVGLAVDAAECLNSGIHRPVLPEVLTPQSMSHWEKFVHALCFIRDVLAWRTLIMGLTPLTQRLAIELRIIPTYLFQNTRQLAQHVPRGGTVTHVRGEETATLHSLSGFTSIVANANSYDGAGAPWTLSDQHIDGWINAIKSVMDRSGLNEQVTAGLRCEIESARTRSPSWAHQFSARWAFNRLMSRISPRYTIEDQRALTEYITAAVGEQNHEQRDSSLVRGCLLRPPL